MIPIDKLRKMATTSFTRFFLILSFTLALSIRGFSQVQGIVVDAETKAPLAFAHIVINDSQEGTLTDIDGAFRLPKVNIQYLTVSYIGYETRRVKVENQKIRIQLQRSSEVLQELVVYEGENPAIPIIERAIERKKINNPENLPYFSLESYNKFTVEAVPTATDTTSEAALFRRSNLFLMESVTEKKYLKPGKYSEKVIANRVSGLKNPSFTTLANGLQPFSFYEDYIELLGVQYTNPLGKPGLRQYNYYLEDSVISDNGKVYIILFETKKKADDQLTGFLHINTNNWALENVIAASENYQGGAGNDDLNVTFKIQQKYSLVGRQWFPKQLNTNFKMQSLTGESVEGIGRTYLDKIDLEKEVAKKEIGRVSLSFDQEANKRTADYWSQYRKAELTPKEELTYQVIDSIGEANNFDRILKGLSALTTNQFKIGKVSLDINRLIGFNRYEGFRLGAGLHTNQDFSRIFTVGGYFGYGFRDEEWKYGGDLSINLVKSNDLQFFTSYSKDVNESGSIAFHKEDKAFSAVRDRKILVNNMDVVTQSQAGFRFYWLKYLDTELSLTSAETLTTSGYTFAENNEQFSTFNTTEASLKIRYAPNVQYVESFFSKIPVYTHHPIFWFNISRGLDLIDGDYEYTRVGLKMYKQSKFRKFGSLTFSTIAFSVFGDTPYPVLFNGMGSFYDNFGLETQNGFQTMRFNEFLSDQFVGVFADMYIGQFTLLKKRSKPTFHLRHNMGWGQLDQPERHQNFEFQTMEDGFFESGLSINNLYITNFSGFGIGVYYRYGPYGLEQSGDNLVFKFNTSILLN